MNITATIAWSLIWSVYPGWPYYGNGLMYAYEPWSNYYTVNGPIWTSAHTCQFIEVRSAHQRVIMYVTHLLAAAGLEIPDNIWRWVGLS